MRSQVLLLPTQYICPVHTSTSVKDVLYFSPVRLVIGDDLNMSLTLKVATSCHFPILSILSITSPCRHSLFTLQCF